jgi:hypothetical protein
MGESTAPFGKNEKKQSASKKIFAPQGHFQGQLTG